MFLLSASRAVFRRRLTIPRSRLTHNSSQSAKSTNTPQSAKQTAKETAKDGASSHAKSSQPIWRRLGPFTVAADAYAASQKKRPYVTQVASALVIYLCADVSAQNISGSDYDPARTARTLLIGAVAAIPQYKWYASRKMIITESETNQSRFIFLSRTFNYSSQILSLAVKVVFNQLTFATLFSSYFFGCQALLSGETLPATFDRLKRTVPRAWTNSWKVWPAATAFALAFIPLEYRALFTGVIAIGWQTYLAWMNRHAELEEAAITSLAVDEGPLIMPVPDALPA